MNVISLKAEKKDLGFVLSLYNQPDMDKGEVRRAGLPLIGSVRLS